MLIERHALRTLLYTMLTCPCPVDEKHEHALVEAFLSSEGDPLNFDAFLSIADRNSAPTPLHLFLRFFADGRETPLADNIVFSDILRYFAGHYHWERSVQSFNPLTMRDSASYLIGHMFLPVSILPGSKGRQALWKTPEGSLLFTETLLFPDIPFAEDGLYALHLGGLVARLSPAEAEMLQRRALLLHDMLRLARETPEIHCAHFYFGRNHREETLSRLWRNGVLFDAEARLTSLKLLIDSPGMKNRLFSLFRRRACSYRSQKGRGGGETAPAPDYYTIASYASPAPRRALEKATRRVRSPAFRRRRALGRRAGGRARSSASDRAPFSV